MGGKVVRIALAGEGGQGVQSIAEIITEAAFNEGKEALYCPNFGLEQRGGVSIAFVQIGDSRIGAPKFKTGDIFIALSLRAIKRCRQYIGPETTLVYDSSIVGAEAEVPPNAARVMAIPAIQRSKEELHPRVFNIVIMGAVIGATGVVTMEQAREALEAKLGGKFKQNPDLRELNYRALEMGRDLIGKSGE
ncbi:MAG: ketoisovalerate oxidoreductase [Syntrophomonadaceae bacterium]|nr:ketoisovalerate oxidoreductase [Syntrophomonadaceae bacterium]